MEIDDALKQIQELLDQKKHAEIEMLALDLAEEHPESIELQTLLGKAAVENNNLKDARYYYSMAKEIDGANVEVLLELARLNLAFRDTEAAKAHYTLVLDADPENLAAKIGIADIFFEAGKYAESGGCYLDILKSGVEDKLDAETFTAIVFNAAYSYDFEDKHENVLEIIEHYAPKKFNESIAALKLKALQITAPDASNQIVGCLELLHQNVPEQSNYILELLSYLESSEDIPKRKALFSKLFDLEMPLSQKSEALRLRIRFNEELQNWAEALVDLDALIDINDDEFLYEKRAIIKRELKDFKGAIQDLTQAIEMTGGNDEYLLFKRGELFVLEENFEPAISDFATITKTSQLKRNRANAFYQLGMIYQRQAAKDEAFKMLVNAEALDHREARELLSSDFSERMAQRLEKAKAANMKRFADEFERNAASPIISKAIGELWVPNMEKVFQQLENDIATMPGKLVKPTLERLSKELFLITPQALLLIESGTEPLEAFYKIEVESEHGVLIELLPSKSGVKSKMRLSFFEGYLLVSYPVKPGQPDSSFKYFKNAVKATDEQKKRLNTKTFKTPYVPAIEELIATIAD